MFCTKVINSEETLAAAPSMPTMDAVIESGSMSVEWEDERTGSALGGSWGKR